MYIYKLGEKNLIKPYTYLLINESSWYIGVRVANKVPASEDTQYMSSSKYIKQRIVNGEVFVKHILGEYNTREEASAAEDEYLRTYWDVPGRVNKGLGFTYEFDNEVKAKKSMSMKVAHTCHEYKAKRNASLKAASARLEVKAKRSASQKAAQNRPVVKAKHSASQKAANLRPEVQAKRSAALKASQNRPDVQAKFCKPCTIDGVTIYKSRNELVAELGQGKNGARSPHFRYINISEND